MADQHEGGAQRLEFGFQPFDGRKVEMVGRLVEEQDVGFGRQRAGNGGAADLAARQALRVFIAGEPQFAQQIGAAVRIIRGPKARLDIVEHGCVGGKIRLLRQVADGGAGLHPALALVGLDHAGGDLEKRRLARAVAPDERHALALGNSEFGVFENGAAAEGQADAAEMKENSAHAGGGLAYQGLGFSSPPDRPSRPGRSVCGEKLRRGPERQDAALLQIGRVAGGIFAHLPAGGRP